MPKGKRNVVTFA